MNTRQQKVVCRGDLIKMREREQQIGWDELKDCSVCGSPLLKGVDFDGNTPTQLICINCRQIDTRDKSTINASILEQQQQEEAYYTSDGVAKYSNYDNNKIIPDNDISRQRDIQAINAALTKTVSTNGKIDIQQNTITAKHGKIIIDWNKIIGYEEIKHIIDAALNSTYKKRTHILLCGAPGTSKTVFLLTILESMKKLGINAHYLDATTLSSAGVIEYMFSHDMEFCLLDELDKLSKEHQATFLNCFETGRLQETKGSISKNNPKIRQKDMSKCTFIVTANYQDKILKPLFTRMMTLLIPEYTKEQFYQIGEQLLVEQYDKTKEIAFYIVDNIYRIYTEERKEKPNLRYARDVAILTNNDKSVIDPILKGIAKYSKKYDE